MHSVTPSNLSSFRSKTTNVSSASNAPCVSLLLHSFAGIRRRSRRRRVLGIAMVGALRRLQLNALLVPGIRSRLLLLSAIWSRLLLSAIVSIALAVLEAALRRGIALVLGRVLRRWRVVRRRRGRHPARSVQRLGAPTPAATRVAAIRNRVSMRRCDGCDAVRGCRVGKHTRAWQRRG